MKLMINIEISEAFKSTLKAASIERAAKSILEHLSVAKGSSLTILITSDKKIQALNHQFRDVDAPTDVLAFPAGHTDPESGETYLGDVIISYQRAARQAEERDHDVKDEIQLLVIHGILHLLGYDHADIEERQRMWAIKGLILGKLNIGLEILADR
jgi:probable rRNA maturation factor